jgi:YVTN family beta-propeller protein
MTTTSQAESCIGSFNNPRETSVIPVGSNPISVAFSKDGTRAFVCHDTLDAEGEISVIDVEASEVIDVLKVDRAVRAIAVSPDGQRFIVCWQNGGWLFDAVTLKAIKATPGVGSDTSVEYSPDGQYIYFASLSGPQFHVLDAERLEEVYSIDYCGSPKAIAISPTKSRAYISGEDNGEIMVFDTDARKIVNTIAVGKEPFDAAISGDGRLLCVCNYSGRTISFVDLDTEVVVGVAVVESSPVAIASSPDGLYVYVALNTEDAVVVIDNSTFKEVRRFSVGSLPFDVAVHPAGTCLYVANLASSSVSVISLEPVVSKVIEDFELADLQTITEAGEVMSTDIFKVTLLDVEVTESKQYLEIANVNWGGRWVSGNALYNFDAYTDKMMTYSLELLEGTASAIKFWVAGGNNTSLIPYLDVWFMNGPEGVIDAQHIPWPPGSDSEKQIDSGLLQGIQSIKIRTNGQFVIDQIEVVRE